MRTAHGLTSFLGAGQGRRVSCGRCGDSFLGRAAEGREWLEMHVATEHETRSAVAPKRVSLAPATPARVPQYVPSV